MPEEQAGEITALLRRIAAGEVEAEDLLIERVYGELRAVAGGVMRAERADHTLQPTALVNEAYLKLFGERRLKAPDRAYFFAAVARAMRQILVDHARKRAAAKRPDARSRVPLDDVLRTFEATHRVDLLWLHDALERLREFGPRQHDVVVHRFFTGLTNKEIADVLGVSLSTVEKDWRAARAWLHAELADGRTR